MSEAAHTYNYGGQTSLTPTELFFMIAFDETCKQIGLEDANAMILILLGWPFVPTRRKPGGATKGTSVASIWARSTFGYEFKRRVLPTFTLGSIARFRWILTRKLGVFIGRAVPGVGWVLLASDVSTIVYHTILQYNRLVVADDRVF